MQMEVIVMPTTRFLSSCAPSLTYALCKLLSASVVENLSLQEIGHFQFLITMTGNTEMHQPSELLDSL